MLAACDHLQALAQDFRVLLFDLGAKAGNFVLAQSDGDFVNGRAAANLRSVWTRMGTPPSSLNCLVGAFFLDFAAEAGAMRVPRPAAGTMTNTFIGAISIVQALGFG